jgi:hypothetical protein
MLDVHAEPVISGSLTSFISNRTRSANAAMSPIKDCCNFVNNGPGMLSRQRCRPISAITCATTILFAFKICIP